MYGPATRELHPVALKLSFNGFDAHVGVGKSVHFGLCCTEGAGFVEKCSASAPVSALSSRSVLLETPRSEKNCSFLTECRLERALERSAPTLHDSQVPSEQLKLTIPGLQ